MCQCHDDATMEAESLWFAVFLQLSSCSAFTHVSPYSLLATVIAVTNAVIAVTSRRR